MGQIDLLDELAVGLQQARRAWCVDRVAGAVTLTLALAVALAVLVAAVAGDEVVDRWYFALNAPSLVAFAMAVVAIVARRRSRVPRRQALDGLGFTRTNRVQRDLAAGTTRDDDRAAAAAMVLRDGGSVRIQGWASLGIGAAQSISAAVGGPLWGVSVGVAVVSLGCAAVAFHQLGDTMTQAATLLTGTGDDRTDERTDERDTSPEPDQR